MKLIVLMNIVIAVALAGLVREKTREEGDMGLVEQHGDGSIKRNSFDKVGDSESLGDKEENRSMEKDKSEIDASNIGNGKDVHYKTEGETSRIKRQARRHRKNNSFMKMRFGRSTNENFQDQEASRF